MSGALGISFLPEVKVTSVERIVITKTALEEVLRKQGLEAEIVVENDRVVMLIEPQKLFKSSCFSIVNNKLAIDMSCLGIIRVENGDIVVDLSKAKIR